MGTPFQFSCFISIVSLLGLGEYYRMALPKRKWLGIVASIAGAVFPFCVPFLDSSNLLLVLTSVVIVSAVMFLFSLDDIRSAAAETSLFVFGFLYISLLLSHFVLLRALPNGVEWIFLMLLLVMGSDTAAYYVGSSLGRHKLYPAVSPNKSIEGAVGGLAGSVAGAFIAKYTFFGGLSVVDCIATGILLGTLAQLGDLFESLLKRSFGVKDSGWIIPGHGGILDRLDSIIFAVPAVFYYALLVYQG